LLPEPFERNRFERILETGAFNLPLRSGIDACGESPARFLAPLARVLQWDIGISAETDHALAPRVAISEAPQPSAGWGDEQVQPATIAQLVRPFLGFRGANARLVEFRHLRVRSL
jgi:hypothetical protein